MEKQLFSIEAELISTNPATHRFAIDYSPQIDLIAFASGPLVYIASLQNSRIYCSLRGHKQNVNSVKWIQPFINAENPNTYDLVSVGADSNIIHWKCQGDPKNSQSWILFKEYPAIHKASIELLSLMVLPKSIFLVTYSIDGMLNLMEYLFENKQFVVKASLQFGKHLLEASALYMLDLQTIILAVGGFTSQIHLYTFLTGKSTQLEFKCSLSGHQNSIRDLSFIRISNGDLLLASGSMDGYARIWKIKQLSAENIKDIAVKFTDIPEEDSKLHEQYESKTSYVFEDINSHKFYNIILESLLSYHAEGINSLQWGYKMNYKNTEGTLPNLLDLRILTGANDGEICYWAAAGEGLPWNVVSTFGQMTSGTKYAVYGSCFCHSNHQEILAYTYNGCMFRWVYNETTTKWDPAIVPTGHFGPVNDIVWDPSEQFLLSCSSDMQTKIFGNLISAKSPIQNQWHEISRPQVHGYEINSIVSLPLFTVPDDKICTPFRIISAGDEKVLRVFDPPYLFMKAGNQLCNANFKYSLTKENKIYEEEMTKSLTSAALSTPLTLMNKPISINEEGEEGNPATFKPEEFLSNKTATEQQQIAETTFLAKNEPPQEHFLGNFGLWPEMQKMYGHAFEVQCLAITKSYKYIASSAKANKAKDAYIIIWDTASLKEICKLVGHQLSVTQLEFSNDDNYLLSIGRDRQWILFSNYYTSKPEIVQKKPEAHSRIIWSCNWADDNQMFVTASREKKQSVKFWAKKDKEWSLDSSIATDLPTVSAIRFFPNVGKRRIIAGTEEGDLSIWQKEETGWLKTFQISASLAHGGSVQRIIFNKTYSKKNVKKWLIATASADRSVRIFKLTE